MTALDIAKRLSESAKGITHTRVEKAQRLARVHKIDWQAVLETLSINDRKLVQDAGQE